MFAKGVGRSVIVQYADLDTILHLILQSAKAAL